MRKIRWTWAYGISLLAFSLYTVLDTFVITRVYTVVEQEEEESSEDTSAEQQVNTSASEEDQTSEDNSTAILAATASEEPVVTATSYSDDNIKITITEYERNDTIIHVADVQVTSAEYLQTAFAQSAYGKNVTDTTSSMAEENEAILAVNGDYYGARNSGYVIRDGVLYRSTSAGDQEDLVIWSDGSFSIINESEVTAEELVEQGAMEVLSFGPALIMDGQISVDENDEVGKAMASNPRTAIGVIDDLHYVFIVSDGRTEESEGLSLYELAEFCQELGVTTCYNLDGGGSSTMVFNGTLINTPTTTGRGSKERSVSDIVYIG